MSNSKIAKRVSAELIEFSDSINPSEGYITKGTELVEAVFTKLKGVHKSGALSRFKVDRAVYGGSVGKKTSVIYPDFDCVVFLNDVIPPLTTFLEEFKTILENNAEELNLIPESIEIKKITVAARFENGVEMDLLAACNFSQDPDEQHKLVLNHIESNLGDCLLYSSSLAKLQVNFMKSQSSFTHQLVRLAKYWYKSLSLDENVYGGSAMMEILCAAVVAENPPSISMLEAFKQFLRKVVEMDTLRIKFSQVEAFENGSKVKKWKLVDYENHVDWHISGSNYIIEPANPYNDMSKNISDKVFPKLIKFAMEMIKRVAQLEDERTNDMIIVYGQMLVSIDFSKLFEPFPLRLSNEYSVGDLPTEALVDYQYATYYYNSAEPQLFPNKSSFDEPRKAVTKVIVNNLAFLIRAPRRKEFGDKTYIPYTNGVAHVTLEDVKGAVERLTSVNFKPNCIKESSSDREHSGYDVTVYAPYYCDGEKYAVRLSLKWSSGGQCVIM